MNGCKRWIVTFLTVFLVVAAFASGATAVSLMVERNLFAPDRKPPVPDSPDAGKGQGKPGLSPKAIQLDGIMSVGETRKAIIRAKTPGSGPSQEKGKSQSPYTTVQEGDTVGEYRVVKIESKSVSLEKDGQSIVVNIFAEGKVVPPPPPTPAAASGASGPAGQDAARASREKAPVPGAPPGSAGPPGIREGAGPGGETGIVRPVPVRTPYPPGDVGEMPEGGPEGPGIGEVEEGGGMEEGAE